MPRIPGSTEGLPKAKKTVIQTLTDPIFNVLDAPANATRSLAAFARTGNTEFLTNAPLSMIPFGGSTYTSGRDVTGSDNFLANAAVLLAMDPLLVLGGVGTASKSGKLLNSIRKQHALVKGMRAHPSLVSELKVEGKVLQDMMSEFRKLPMVEKTGTRRHLFTLTGGKPVGDAAHLKAMFPWGMMPDMKRAAAAERVPKLTHQLDLAGLKLKEAKKVRGVTGQKYARDVEKYTKALAVAKDVSKGYRGSLISPNMANKLRAISSRFGHRSDAGKASIAIERYLTARDKAVWEEGGAVLMKQFDELRKAENIEAGEFSRRILKAAETRQLGKKLQSGERDMVGLITDLKSQQVQDMQDATNTYRKMVKKLPKEEEKFRTQLIDRLDRIKIAAYEDSRDLVEINKIWMGGEGLSSDMIALIDKVYEHSDDFVKLERGQRINIDPLKNDLMSYVRRMLTPEAKDLLKHNKNKFNLIFNAAKQRLGPQHKRKLLPEKGILDVNEWARKEHGLKFDLFEPNIVKSAMDRRLEHIQNIHKAATANQALRIHGIPKALAKSKGIKSVPARTFMDRVGLDWHKIDDLPEIAEDLVIPRSTYDELTRVDYLMQKSLFNDPRIVQSMKWMDDNVNSWFRFGLTTPFPSFHHRNFVGNLFLNLVGGVGPQWLNKARIMMKKARNGELVGKELAEWTKMGSLQIEHGGHYASMLEISPRAAGKLTKVLDKPGISHMRRYGMYIEDQARVAHYLAKRSAGHSPFQAQASVNRYLFNYRDLTSFERKIMRPNILFYTWIKNNLPLMVATSVKNPKLVNAWNKMMGIGGDEVPDYLRSASVVPVGDSTFFSDPGVPLTDLNLLNVDDADPTASDQLMRIVSRLASRASPIPKLAFELASGKSSFSLREHRTMGEILLENLPTSRVFRTISKAIDPDDSVAARLLQALTGIKKYKMSPLKGQEDLLERIMIQEGLGRKFEVVGRKFSTDPESKAFKQINDELKKIRSKKRKERNIRNR